MSVYIYYILYRYHKTIKMHNRIKNDKIKLCQLTIVVVKTNPFVTIPSYSMTGRYVL